jgi:hydrogenase nickel incorporation protein HypB
MLLNKIDLLPYVSFKLDLAIEHARRVNPALTVIKVSATTGEGFEEWLAWLEAGCAGQKSKKQETVASLKRRIAELEAQTAASVRS